MPFVAKVYISKQGIWLISKMRLTRTVRISLELRILNCRAIVRQCGGEHYRSSIDILLRLKRIIPHIFVILWQRYAEYVKEEKTKKPLQRVQRLSVFSIVEVWGNIRNQQLSSLMGCLLPL